MTGNAASAKRYRNEIIKVWDLLTIYERRITVSSGNSTSDLGPLPIADSNSSLERKSIDALHALLKGHNTLLFRDERTSDYGVDGSFELIRDGRVTNFRGQVQLKATGQLRPNKDGSISFSVRTASLNYLLNGIAPIYLLYDDGRDEFWYAWAQEESRRLESENAGWREREWITLKFKERFSQATLPILWERILSEGRLRRTLHDSLARATGSEPVFFRIDTNSLAITDPSQARDVLLASGTAIVAAGYPKEVLNLFRLLDSGLQENARIQLAAGYAEFTIGDHYAALGHLRRALARSADLSQRDQSFLNTLKDASEVRIGIIDTAIYQQRLAARGQALSGLESLEARQDELFHRCLTEKDPARRAGLAEQLRVATEEILQHKDGDRGVRLDARLVLLYIEGIQANVIATQKLFSAGLRAFLFPSDRESILRNIKDARDRHTEWERQASEALKEAYDLGHPVLIVQALTVALNVRLGRLLDLRLEAIANNASYTLLEKDRAMVQRMFDEAYELCRLNGMVESRLRLQKLETDFLEIQGDLASAESLAEKLHPEADAMGFAVIAERASEILEKRTLIMRYTEQCRNSDARDDDENRANQTDAELTRITAQTLQTIGSPPAHPKKLYGYMRTVRWIAQVRCRWCRHLQLLEDIRETRDPLNAFSTTPMRTAICQKFGHQSRTESVDVFVIVDDFKRDYCGTCAERSPKGC